MTERLWAVEKLRANGILVDTAERIIDMLGKEGPGIRLWRCIDCLCNFYGFRWSRGY